MSSRLRTALIIPALNEEPVIGSTLASIPPGLFDTIIVADNGSSDATGAIARSSGATVVREEERGYGAACLCALRSLPPGTDIVLFMQADLSEDPAQAGLLLEPIQSGCADMVMGCRTGTAVEPGAVLLHQRFGNWLATSLIRCLYGVKYKDLGPFRAIRVQALERLGMQECNYGWTVEMQIRAIQENLRVLEVPVSYRLRAAGENKVSGNLKASILAGIKIISTIFRVWRKRPSAWHRIASK
ncbi:MAG TPA: glycosyltransferase family 2 protein [Bryobacteraceae bacterium]|nr:glycosyltransferase family 2 protein [Bryobacteraceae bacterium]